LTPKFRTEDEHPLKIRDLKLIKKFFNHSEFRYFHFASLAAILFRNRKIFPFLLKILDFIDSMLFKIFPCLKPLAWQVVIILEEPKK